ncbi:hypothetical protein Dimus_035889 [Dionaea muscipula]
MSHADQPGGVMSSAGKPGVEVFTNLTEGGRMFSPTTVVLPGVGRSENLAGDDECPARRRWRRSTMACPDLPGARRWLPCSATVNQKAARRSLSYPAVVAKGLLDVAHTSRCRWRKMGCR